MTESLRVQKARELIRRLNRLDSKVDSFGTIVELYDQLTTGITSDIITTKYHEQFFRARKISALSKKPAKINELACPPANLIRGFQRCNSPGVPMLYTASTRIGALLEIRVKKWDRVYLSQWTGNDAMPVNIVLHDPLGYRDDKSSNYDDIVLAHIDTVFTRKIHEDYSDDYKFSAAISKILMNGYPAETQFNIQDDMTIGLRYPSVIDIARSYNTVFGSHYVSSRLKMTHVIELVVEEVDRNAVSATVTDNAFEFDGQTIKWSGSAKAVPQLRGERGEVPYISNGKKWLLMTNNESDEMDFQKLLTEQMPLTR
jgi:hypothetical protein